MNPMERAAAVAAFDAKHEPAQVRDLGFALLDVAAAQGRYRWAVDRLERSPRDVQAIADVNAAQARVVETVERWNREVAEFRRGQAERGAA